MIQTRIGGGVLVKLLVAALLGAVLLLSRTADGDSVLLETEAFDDHGGWVLDQQFMDLMGSPFLLAHGMGRPVADARTTVEIPTPGRHQVWVRTRDWVAPWNASGAPGRFQVLIDGAALETTFGTEGISWHWQDGGQVTLGERAVVGLHDLTGFEGRCDAILLVPEGGSIPPEDPEALQRFRREALGHPEDPEAFGSFDLVVIGGGMAGTSAAVTAARLGLSVALIQDRPVLGGNSSSEVRVWPQGHVNQSPWPRVGDVVMELVPERRSDSHNAQSATVFDDDRKLRVAAGEPNLTLFLGQRMNAAFAEDGIIRAVVCEDVRTGRRGLVQGRWFLDSTGDASLGFLVGADFEQTETGHMGASNLWNIKCLCEDEDPLSSELEAACEEATFPRCPWAVDLADKPFPGRSRGATSPEPGARPISLGEWYWESGFDRDPINDMERIRDQNFRAMYGAWDAIKNVEGRYPAHRLNWVAYIAGKRESRRLLGDVVLNGEDLRDGVRFIDGCVPCTWGIDTHHPNSSYSKGHEGDEFIADFTHGEGYEYAGPYWVPYRCLYSRNIRNLFMAGRDISVTHEALGAVRVMKTTGAMGEIVGMAAALCKRNDCNPREIYSRHLGELQSLMSVGAGRPVEAEPNGDIGLTARSARIHGTQLRYEPERDALGYWRTSTDSAAWSVRIPVEMTFDVVAMYACPEAEAGSSFTVRCIGFDGGHQELSSVVKATASWDDHEGHVLGTITLPAGDHLVSMASGKAEGPLMKLRGVRLVAHQE
ncbi:MAG: FAD-dependent oxidoreductase [Phycisphaerales bacterium]|nr:FAD-dependent oxidoreductase [Phycisphaerales bacterium]